MLQNVRTITSKGQVTIPSDLRDEFELFPGEKVQFVVEEEEIKVKPVLGLDDLIGSLPVKKKFNKKKARELIRKEAVDRYAKNL